MKVPLDFCWEFGESGRLYSAARVKTCSVLRRHAHNDQRFRFEDQGRFFWGWMNILTGGWDKAGSNALDCPHGAAAETPRRSVRRPLERRPVRGQPRRLSVPSGPMHHEVVVKI